jgi:hypothetical protein
MVALVFVAAYLLFGIPLHFLAGAEARDLWGRGQSQRMTWQILRCRSTRVKAKLWRMVICIYKVIVGQL